MKRILLSAVSVAAIALLSVVAFDQPSETTQAASPQQTESLSVADFSGDSHAEQIQNAINAASNNEIKTVFVPAGDYYISSTLTLKENVKLQFAHNARLVIYGNQDVLNVERNASVDGAYIAIDDTKFQSNVFSFDGANKYYNSWHRSTFENINIVNWTGNNQGTGIELYSHGAGHEISYLHFENIKMAGLHTGIHLQADPAEGGYSWVNANSFDHITIDDTVRGIWSESSITIPNEVSGNSFTNLQIQLSAATKSALHVTGEFNAFSGVIWDTHMVNDPSSLIHLTKNSQETELDMRGNIEVLDQGSRNQY
ncbi:hypothetical protein H0266_13605 [Halobacillus locisalis]|uniref:Pectate lyase superfamily protein domain-containing protein n=1 Tax=Halobacillus locisalis TaxID=220753 RepID=A0A838CVH1_9BACI|nr:glycosyl hydrolase family 28-related protein [Halobacillus locisalis]MBA2175928.1 hypothetical protein [Halobacillus locisalis]